MPKLDPASLGLLIMGTVLVFGIGAAGLGMYLADCFRCWRERRDVARCLRAARDEAGAEEGGIAR